MDQVDKEYTLYFYKLGTHVEKNRIKAEEAVVSFFTESSDPIADALIGEYQIQIQDIASFKSNGCSMVSGVVKKFINRDLPHKGVAGESLEDELPLEENESLIQRTYFIYNLSNHVLLYQANRYGTPCNDFKKYLKGHNNTFPGIKHVLFDFIPTPGALDRLMQGDIKLKELNIRIPRPTVTTFLKNPWNEKSREENSMARNIIELMAGIKGDLNLTLKAGLESDNGTLSPKAPNLLRTLIQMFNMTPRRGPKDKGMKGNIEYVNEDGTIHPIDLVMDKLSAIVSISMDGRYPKPKDIVKKMKAAFSDKQSTLNDIFRGGE